jgi:two-component system sensor histidine kinase/response regulator
MKYQRMKFRILSSLLLLSFFVGIPSAGWCQRSVQVNFDSLTRVLKQQSTDTGKISIWYKLAIGYHTENPDSSELISKRALRLAQKIRSEKWEGHMLHALAMSYWFKNEYDSALRLSQQSLAMAQRQSDTLLEARSYNLIGVCHYYRGEYLKAVELYEKAITLFQQAESKAELGNSYGNLALVYFHGGNFSKSLTYHQKALDMAQSENDWIGISACYTNMAEIYQKHGDIAKARESYQQSLKFSERAGYHQGKAQTLLKLAGIEVAEGNYAKAEKHVQKAQSLFQLVKATRGEALALVVQSDILRARGRVQEALQLNQQALVTFNKIGNAVESSTTQVKMAQLYFSLGKWKESIDYANAAAILAAKLGKNEVQEEAFGVLANVFKQQGDFKKAHHFLEERWRMRDTILARQELREIDRARFEYEISNKQKELDTSEKDKQRAIQQTDEQKLINWMTTGIAVLIAIMAFVVYRNFASQRSINEVLARQKSEIEEQKKELERLGQLKDKIFSVVAHDLKSPMGTLQSMVMLYKNKMVEPGDLDGYFETMESRLRSTTSLLENLLEWARSQMTGASIHPTTFNLAEVLDEVKILFGPMSRSKDIELDFSAEANAVVYADKEMIRSVLRNLISNAIKFSHTGSRVTCRAQTRAPWAVLIISDAGVGMTAEQLNEAWELKKKSSRGTKNETGTGLGLLLCKDFVERNSGTITVTSSKDTGTFFEIKLPITAGGVH